MAFQRGDNLAARSAIEASIALARQTGAEETLAYALALGATINGFLGDVNTARTWSEESQSLSRRHGFAYILAQVTGVEAFLAVTVNQPVPPGLAEEVMRVARASGNPWALGMAFTNVGRLNMVAGHWAESHQLLAEAAALFQKLRDKSMYNSARSEMGHLLRIQGRYTEAAELYRETIQVYQEMGEQAAVAHELECFAFIAAAQSQKERAACLLGAAEALRESLNTDMTPIERREYEKIVADLNATTEDEVFKRGWSRGSEFTVEQAIQLAVALDQGG
jgi:tetratricopeptide (TPR) repeat protein